MASKEPSPLLSESRFRKAQLICSCVCRSYSVVVVSPKQQHGVRPFVNSGGPQTNAYSNECIAEADADCRESNFQRQVSTVLVLNHCKKIFENNVLVKSWEVMNDIWSENSMLNRA